MIWNSFSDFLLMGGYALYVWGSLSVVFIAIIVEMIGLGRRKNTIVHRLRRQNQFLSGSNSDKTSITGELAK